MRKLYVKGLVTAPGKGLELSKCPFPFPGAFLSLQPFLSMKGYGVAPVQLVSLVGQWSVL